LSRNVARHGATQNHCSCTQTLKRFSKCKKIFLFQNALGYPWCCKKLQRWRCHSRYRKIGSKSTCPKKQGLPQYIAPQ
jgi:hypothetical protein